MCISSVGTETPLQYIVLFLCFSFVCTQHLVIDLLIFFLVLVLWAKLAHLEAFKGSRFRSQEPIVAVIAFLEKKTSSETYRNSNSRCSIKGFIGEKSKGKTKGAHKEGKTQSSYNSKPAVQKVTGEEIVQETKESLPMSWRAGERKNKPTPEAVGSNPLSRAEIIGRCAE